MIPRPEVREIPDSDRYFSVELGDDDYHFRFPSYGMAARLITPLTAFEDGDGMERLVELLDLVGYTAGLCWWHRAYDLEAGPAPRSLEGEEWRLYGDAVVDELQEHGLKLPDILAMLNVILRELTERLGEADEAKVEAGN